METSSTKPKYRTEDASWDECYATDGEDLIFLMGGKWEDISYEAPYDPTPETNHFHIYKVSTNSWKKGPSLKWESTELSCIVSSVTKRIYTFGGYPNPQVIQSISLDFESTGENWKLEKAILSSPRSAAKASEVGNGDIYIIGGYSSVTRVSANVEIFMPWRGEISEGPSLRMAHYLHAQMSVFFFNCFARIRTSFVYTPTSM